MSAPKIKKQKSLFKVILFSFFSLATLIILFFSILFILFLVYKDDISKTLLSSINNKIQGEISFSDISFTPFRHFPNAALKFYDLTLLESKDSILNTDKLPVFDIKEAYASVNIIDLFSSKVSVSKISFEGGNVNLIVYPDSQINIQKALKKKEEKKIVAQKNQVSVVDTVKLKKQVATKTSTDFDLNFDDLLINDLELSLENQFKKNKAQLKINELQSEFSYKENQIVSSVSLDTHVDSLIKNNELLFSDTKINFESKLEVDTDSIYVKLEEGSFTIGEATFLFNGIFDSKNQGYVDLSVIGSDEDFSLFSLFLSEEGIKNLKSGNILFNGSVKGKTFIEFPAIDLSFGLKDVELINPITKREIKNLNLKGNFNSGKNDDWSEAELIIDTLYADLPDGFVNLSGSINNFIQPQLNLILFLSADVTGLDKLFNLEAVSDLQGKVEITDKIVGKYLINEKRYVNETNEAKISFNDFGLKIPGTIKFDKINGIITRRNDDIQFENLSVISEDTDFLINGEVKNALALLFNKEGEIIGDLQIKSSVFDLPNFLFFDPSIKRDFNHRILDVDVDVLAKTTTSKATKFKSFPEIEFDIKKINATAEGFLPRIEINSGIFAVSENILGFNLKFKNFKTDFLDGKFNFTGEYNTSKFQPYYIKAKADFKKIYPSELFYSDSDTIPESLSGKLTGSFFTELQFPTDSTVLKFINLKNADLTYEFSSDTFNIKNLTIDLNKIYFDTRDNPLATLSTNGGLTADNIKSSSVNFNDVDLNFDITNGSYEIKSEAVRLFGENAKGKLVMVLSPFKQVPEYKLVVNNVSFRAERMLNTFNEDSVITGKLRLSLDLNSFGSEWDLVVSNMSGTVNLSGDNLILYGLDADEVIEKFKRSQSFNLVDLGAILLAGPVGIAVTKGTDFARIFVLNAGKSTTINKLVSNWIIRNGVFSINDAAFTTNKNRIAITGSIGFSDEKLDLTIALLNKNGCSIFSQNVYGNLNSSQIGKVKVVETVLAPVTNFVDDLIGKDCVVFYQGAVEHPE